jgi:hypothetical protein
LSIRPLLRITCSSLSKWKPKPLPGSYTCKEAHTSFIHIVHHDNQRRSTVGHDSVTRMHSLAGRG